MIEELCVCHFSVFCVQEDPETGDCTKTNCDTDSDSDPDAGVTVWGLETATARAEDQAVAAAQRPGASRFRKPRYRAARCPGGRLHALRRTGGLQGGGDEPRDQTARLQSYPALLVRQRLIAGRLEALEFKFGNRPADKCEKV
jgi:hypothetical protein